MVVTVLALVVGVALLAIAADQFVVGAARVASIRRLSPVFVGVVIVGFGTSSPELLVSVLAAARGDVEIAVGNVVGSNIANLSVMLGVGAMIVPIAVRSSTVRREVPIAVGATVAFGLAIQSGLARREGALLLIALGATLWWLRRGTASENESADPLAEDVDEFAGADDARLGVEIARTVVGLIGTIAAAQLLLFGAVDLAERADLGKGFVGATLVALGTSLPELVTVVQSARRRETDLIVGNLLGSNLFNALAVGGVAGLVGPGPLDDRALTQTAALAAVLIAVVAAGAMLTQRRVARWEGAALVLAYACVVPLLA